MPRRYLPGGALHCALADAAAGPEEEMCPAAASKASEEQRSGPLLPPCSDQSTPGKRGGPSPSSRKKEKYLSKISAEKFLKNRDRGAG